MLNAEHTRVLREESGISDEVIRQRGYRSITEAAELRALGFAEAQCRPPGLLLPLWSTDGGGPGEDAHAKARRGKDAKEEKKSHAKTQRAQSKESFLSLALFASLREIFLAPLLLSALA